ncbi:MAG: diguanylate cyclase [Solirubrobacteraceae bacterium]
MLPRRTGHWRRSWSVGAAAIGLAILLAALAGMIVSSQHQSRAQMEANFRLRGSSSATLIGTYIAQQAQRQQSTAQRFLSTPNVSRERFETIAYAFGSQAAVLANADGVVLDVLPYDPTLIGRRLTARYPAAETAARATLMGSAAVSNLVDTGRHAGRVAAIAVPFQTAAQGRRVFAAAYGVGGDQLNAFVEHTSTARGHEVLLLDGTGRVLAASPRTSAPTLAAADPALARALARSTSGSFSGPGGATTFTAARVPGTPWRIVVRTPDSSLFSTIDGATQAISWLVFALIAVLGALLLALFGRSMADRARLSALSGELEEIARTDPLTGLLNRRGVQESLARLAARARRDGAPLTILMIDLDRFKEINDRNGHDAGDRVLCLLADCMRDVLRSEDVYGRMGGDEFVVAMADPDRSASDRAAARLSAAASAVDLSDLGLSEGIPLSVGVATDPQAYPEGLMRAADAELYREKDAKYRSPAGFEGPQPG